MSLKVNIKFSEQFEIFVFYIPRFNNSQIYLRISYDYDLKSGGLSQK